MNIKDIFGKAIKKINGNDALLTELNNNFIVSIHEDEGYATLYPRDKSKYIVPNTLKGEGRFAHGGLEGVHMYRELDKITQSLSEKGIADARTETSDFEQGASNGKYEKKVMGFIIVPIDDKHQANKRLMKKLYSRDPQNNIYIANNARQH